MKKKLKRIIQITVGIIFIASGVFKVVDSQSFSNLFNTYGFGWAGNIAPVISTVEIILGLCLILDILTKTTSLVTISITIFFSLGFSYAFFFRGIEDCGCMGSFVNVPPYISFARNILIIAGCWWIWKYFENDEVRTKNWKKWTVYILGGITLCVSCYTLTNPLVQKDKNFSVGEQINKTIFQYFEDKISNDTCIVFIFKPDCDHCWNATENIKSIKRTPGFTNVIGITYHNADTSQYMKEMKPNFEILKYPTPDLQDYLTGVPILLMLKDGKVIKEFKAGDFPCGPMLRKMFNDNGIVYPKK